MLSDVVTTKQTAIASIKGAVLGLLLILSTYLILTQINPDITDSSGINLSTIVVPDDDDRDEQIIEDMCRGEKCGAQACDGTETECEEQCEEYSEMLGSENTYYNNKTKACHYIASDNIADYPSETIEESCVGHTSNPNNCSEESCVNDDENYHSFKYGGRLRGPTTKEDFYFCVPLE